MSICVHYCCTCGKQADVDGLICGSCGEQDYTDNALVIEELAAVRQRIAELEIRINTEKIMTENATHERDMARQQLAEAHSELDEVKGIVGFPGTIALQKHGLSESLPDVVRYCHREWLTQIHSAGQRVIALESRLDKAETQLAESQERERILTEALEQYADRDNWCQREHFDDSIDDRDWFVGDSKHGWEVAAEKTLRQLLPPARKYEGSVEGRLETISIHGKARFILYHAITKKAVTCHISEDDLATVKDALGHKVLVEGVITINVKSEPIRMDAASIRVIGNKRLPLASELTGSDPEFTGDLTTDEYIRSIRNG